MKTKFFAAIGRVLATLFLSAIGAAAANVQLVSILNDSNEVPATANGDSSMPIVTPDGRYVLFASAANNLVMTNGDGSVTGGPRHWLNVYLRDRLAGTTSLVSVNVAGVCAGGNCYPTGISTNGQFALFESAATDLVTNDVNGANNVYVRDVVNNVTTLVSINTNGLSGNGFSFHSVMTPDGQYVAFTSSAKDLTSNDTNATGLYLNGNDVFVRDLWEGTTTLASVGGASTNLTPSSDGPAITPDGRFVAYDSYSFNQQTFSFTTSDVYVRDLIAGTTSWVSTNAKSIFDSVYDTTNASSVSPSISDDGQFVAYETILQNPSSTSEGIILQNDLQTGVTEVVCTNASDLIGSPTYQMTPNGRFIALLADTSGPYGDSVIDVWDADTGTNTPVSVDCVSGLPVTGVCAEPVINSTGQYVAFLCSGSNVTTNAVPGGYFNLYLRDLDAGYSYLVDSDTNGAGDGLDDSCTFSMADNGTVVAFDSGLSSLVPGDFNRSYDVFTADPMTATIQAVSVPALPSQSPDGFTEVYPGCLSTNDRYVAYVSTAENLVPNDTNEYRQVYVNDLVLETNTLVSVGTNGFAGNGHSSQPSISGNGEFVTFSSFAPNLMTGEPSGVEQVFRRDLLAGTNALVSVSTNGGFGNYNSFSPAISSDGRFVLYYSLAENLAPNLPSGFLPPTNLFVRDFQLNTTYVMTTGLVDSASMTPDGHYVAFIGINQKSSSTRLYVWNSQTALLSYTNASLQLTNVSISADGRWVAYTIGSTLEAYDLVGKTNYLIGTAAIDSHSGMQFDGSDRYLVFATKTSLVAADLNGTYDVYVHDFQVGTNLLVSRSYNSANTANGPSYLPAISPSGRFIAYRSLANNIVPNSGANEENVFVYDLSNNATMLLSVDQPGTAAANSFSTAPVISSDSSTLAFESYASDLLAPAFNEFSSIYTFSLTNYPVAGNAGGGTGGGSTNPNYGVNAQLTFSGGSQSPWLTWPLASGENYQVQFEDDLSGTDWQPVNGGIVFIGGTAGLQDLSPSPTNRFYRIVSY